MAGCRLPGHEGPVPKSLAECRRLSQQGVAALDRGRQQDAEALLAKAVAACPADAEARRHYAESLWRRGARQEAIAQLEESGRLAGDDASLWTRLAEMYLAAGQLELASKNAERAIDLDPRLPGAWAIRGGVMRAAGQPGEALTCYLRALGYAPKDRAILLEVAELYRQQNQPERSLQTLQCLADTYSPGEEPGQVHHLLGQAYVALGRYDDAVESLSLAVNARQAHGRDVLPPRRGPVVGGPSDGSGGDGAASPGPATAASAQPRPARTHPTRPAAAGNDRGSPIFPPACATAWNRGCPGIGTVGGDSCRRFARLHRCDRRLETPPTVRFRALIPGPLLFQAVAHQREFARCGGRRVTPPHARYNRYFRSRDGAIPRCRRRGVQSFQRVAALGIVRPRFSS